MTTIAELIAAYTARWGVTVIEESVFGTGDPTQIEAMVDQFCQRSLGAAAVEGLAYQSSVGCVVGVGLDNGERVVLKAYQARWPTVFLDAVATVQRHLAAQGFCCATPLRAAEPLPGRPNLVITESWLDDPGMEPASGGAAQRISAAGLARQIDLCRELGEVPGLEAHPQRELVDGLYPEPHSPLFDFRATSDGAEWIDQWTRRAAVHRQVDTGPLVIAHTDWCARNVRITDHLAAVYDWDSLALVTEATAVGLAAATWAVTSEEGGSDFPTAAQLVSFLGDYETATGDRLNADQWASAGAAAVSLLAYIARCEHALAVTGRARPDQCGATVRLREEGEAMLGLAERRPAD